MTHCLTDPSGRRAPFPLDRAVIAVGKDERSGLLLSDDSVSRKHASLERLPDGSFLLVDAGSRNGTFVNGIAVQQRRLREGDEISFGDRIFRFERIEGELPRSGAEGLDYETSITNAISPGARETRILSSDRESSAVRWESASAWQFLRAFLPDESGGREPEPLEAILDDLAGMEGIGCLSFYSVSPVFGSGTFRHRGKAPAVPSELVGEKLKEAAGSGDFLYLRSGMFESGPASDGACEALICPVADAGALYVEFGENSRATGEKEAIVRGAAIAIARGVRLGKERETAINAATRVHRSVEHGIVGNSPAIRRAIEHARKAARFESPVLITGPSGAGKELIAHLVHDESSRAEKNDLCVVACNELFESLGSELFGHEPGAFTDAKKARAGAFERAGGGTVFLDEIGELSPDLQARLLRILETKTVQRLGGEKRIEVDFRLVAATHRDLQKEVEEGNFREDLFYRISTVRIHLPSLAERIEDLPDLARHFFAEFCHRENLPGVELTDGALERLKRATWPGNVRQLRNVIENAVIFRPEPGRVEADDIILMPEKQGSTPGPDATLEEIRDWHFGRALRFFEGNRKKTAEHLGIARSTFQEWLARREE